MKLSILNNAAFAIAAALAFIQFATAQPVPSVTTISNPSATTPQPLTPNTGSIPVQGPSPNPTARASPSLNAGQSLNDLQGLQPNYLAPQQMAQLQMLNPIAGSNQPIVHANAFQQPQQYFTPSANYINNPANYVAQFQPVPAAQAGYQPAFQTSYQQPAFQFPQGFSTNALPNSYGSQTGNPLVANMGAANPLFSQIQNGYQQGISAAGGIENSVLANLLGNQVMSQLISSLQNNPAVLPGAGAGAGAGAGLAGLGAGASPLPGIGARAQTQPPSPGPTPFQLPTGPVPARYGAAVQTTPQPGLGSQTPPSGPSPSAPGSESNSSPSSPFEVNQMPGGPGPFGPSPLAGLGTDLNAPGSPLSGLGVGNPLGPNAAPGSPFGINAVDTTEIDTDESTDNNTNEPIVFTPNVQSGSSISAVSNAAQLTSNANTHANANEIANANSNSNSRPVTNFETAQFSSNQNQAMLSELDQLENNVSTMSAQQIQATVQQICSTSDKCDAPSTRPSDNCGSTDAQCQFLSYCYECFSNRYQPKCLQCLQLSLAQGLPEQIKYATKLCKQPSQGQIPQICNAIPSMPQLP